MGGCDKDAIDSADALRNAQALYTPVAPISTRRMIFNKTYHGFEDAVDIERDISEMFEGKGIPGEFQGAITITVTYVE